MKCTIAMMFAFSILAVATHAQPLIGHWTLDETSGTTAFDSVAGGTDGAIGSNVTVGVPGAVGTAYSFPGGTTQNDIVDFGDAAFIDEILLRDRMSISAWFNWTFNHVARGTAISIASSTTNTNFIDLGVTGSAPTAPQPPVFPNGRRFNTKGGMYGGINIAGDLKDEVVNTSGLNDDSAPFPGGGELVTAIPPGSGTALDDGAWHHVAMTINAGLDVVELFVDGVSVGTNPSPPIIDDFSNLMDNFEVGRLGRLAPAGLYNGQVDDIQIYRRVLTANEVSFLFQNPGEVVIPEPASLALLGLGGIALLVCRRRG